MLKHGILGLLNYGSMTGYEIDRTFRDSLRYFWNAQTSQIYRELQTLRDKGWATDETIEQSGRPDKKLFTITPAGREELARWLREPTDAAMRIPLLMKTFFRGECSREENLQYFDALQARYEGFLRQMTAQPPDVEGYANAVSDPEKALYWQMTVEYGVLYCRMMLDWIHHCKEELEANAT